MGMFSLFASWQEWCWCWHACFVDWVQKFLKLHPMPWMNKWCLKMPMCFDASVSIAFPVNNWQHGCLIHHGNHSYHLDLRCAMTQSTSDPALIWSQQHLHDSNNHHSNLNFQSFILPSTCTLFFLYTFIPTMSSFFFISTHTFHTQKQHFLLFILIHWTILFFFFHLAHISIPLHMQSPTLHFSYTCFISFISLLLPTLNFTTLNPRLFFHPLITHTPLNSVSILYVSYLSTLLSKQTKRVLYIFLSWYSTSWFLLFSVMPIELRTRWVGKIRVVRFITTCLGSWFVRAYPLPIWKGEGHIDDKKSTSLGSKMLFTFAPDGQKWLWEKRRSTRH